MRALFFALLTIVSTQVFAEENFLYEEEGNVAAQVVENVVVIERNSFELSSVEPAVITDVQQLVNGEEIVTVERNGLKALLVPGSIFDRSVAVTMADTCVAECSAVTIAGALAGGLAGAESGASLGAPLGPKGFAGGAVIGGTIGGVAGGMGAWGGCSIATGCGKKVNTKEMKDKDDGEK